MADRQRLKLTLRDRIGKREWTHQAVTVTADPEDLPAIVEHLVEMARDLDHRGQGAPWWIEQYAVRVQGLDQEWRDFEVVGGEH
jgi:hypothetical protein